MLTIHEKSQGIIWAKASLNNYLLDQPLDISSDIIIEHFGSSSDLLKNLGSFVTLKTKDNDLLRGCIGSIVSDDPLYINIQKNAINAGTNDPRFPSVTLDDFNNLCFEISVMGELDKCLEPEKIVVGKHGLVIKNGPSQGLLLPQVPIEWNWSRQEFIEHTCEKAGLSKDSWKSSATEIYWFESEVFGEEDF